MKARNMLGKRRKKRNKDIKQKVASVGNSYCDIASNVWDLEQ
jgi:hypothetical protein